MKKINEENLRKVLRQRILEETAIESKTERKPMCVSNNTIPLDEIVGKSSDYVHYTPSVMKRGGGVNSMVDTIGILNNLRLFKDVNFIPRHVFRTLANRPFFAKTKSIKNPTLFLIVVSRGTHNSKFKLYFY